MKDSFRCFALGLALTTAVVSANAFADSITGTARAVVVVPANVSDTVLIYSTNALVSGVTGNLIIRLPGGAGLSRTDNGYLHPASVTSLAVVSNGCLQNIRILASCVKHMAKDGMLNGNPVSNIMLNTADDTRSARHDVGITVTYN